MMGSKSIVFSFADVKVREREFCLIKAGEVFPVEPKAFRVLLFLLNNPQKLIKKDELLDAVWSDSTVSENSLTRSVALLRRLLGDDVREPRYIATVPTVGYRFLCPVEVSEDAAGNLDSSTWTATLNGTSLPKEHANGSAIAIAPPEPLRPVIAPIDSIVSPAPIAPVAIDSVSSESKAKGQARGRLWKWLLVALPIPLVALAAAAWYLLRPLPPPRVTDYTQITHDGQIKDLVGTDGSRLYFNQIEPESIAQVAVSGGEIAQLQVPLPYPFLRDVSPDGSTLLVMSGSNHSNLWNLGILGGSLRHIADAANPSAAWSPDGRFIVYSTSSGDIRLVRTDGAEDHKLISTGEQATYFSWSSEGSRIRFTNKSSLWEMASDGTNLHPLIPDWHGAPVQCCGRWTPDGNFYVFSAGGPLLTMAPLLPGEQLWALDERKGRFRHPSGHPTQLTSGPLRWGAPIPGKDGKTIFARGVTTRGELVRFDVQSGQFQPFLQGISAEFLSFDRSGQKVTYVTFPDGKLWKANRDGSMPVELSGPSMYPRSLSFSPDGARVLFVDAPSSAARSKDYVIPAEGGTPQRLIPQDSGPQGDATWSPDGSRIAFSTLDEKVFDAKSDIRILDLASGRVTKVPGSEGTSSPRWSPDGRTIAGLSTVTHALKVFDIQTQRWSTIYQEPAEFPTWSRDGRFIYFARAKGNPGIFRIRATGGEAERVVDLRGFHSTGWYSLWFGLDPTDAPLVLHDVGTDDIYALTLDRK